MVLCLVIMSKWIDCLSDLSMMDYSGVIGMLTARVSARKNFGEDHAHFRLTTRPLPVDLGKPSALLKTTPTFD